MLATDAVQALWLLRRHTMNPRVPSSAYHLEMARAAARAREDMSRGGASPPDAWHEDAYTWHAKSHVLMKSEHGERWAALEWRPQWECGVVACEMAVEVWEASAPKEGYDYVIPEVLGEYRVEFDICRRAFEALKGNIHLAGRALQKRTTNPLKEHFEGTATGELSMGGLAYLSYLAVSTILDAAMEVDPVKRQAVLDLEKDPIWRAIVSAITIRALQLSPGKSSDDLEASVILNAADEWWERCSRDVPKANRT